MLILTQNYEVGLVSLGDCETAFGGSHSRVLMLARQRGSIGAFSFSGYWQVASKFCMVVS